MSKVQSRCDILRDLLKRTDRVTLSEAASLLSVSESSARRVFDILEEQGEALRIHGAIVPLLRTEYSYEEVENCNREEKEAIGAFCADSVLDGETIYLDSGTTAAAFASALRGRIERDALTVHVFTNSMVNLGILASCTEVDLIGGRYHQNRKDMSGFLAETMIKNLHFDRAFLGTDGIAVGIGFTARDFSAARLNELVMASSARTSVMADGDKLNSAAVVSFTRYRMPNELITSSSPGTELQNYLSSEGVSVFIADISRKESNL